MNHVVRHTNEKLVRQRGFVRKNTSDVQHLTAHLIEIKDARQLRVQPHRISSTFAELVAGGSGEERNRQAERRTAFRLRGVQAVNEVNTSDDVSPLV